MTTMMWIAGLMLTQGGGQATTRPATTPNPNAATTGDVQTAARGLRDAIRNNVAQEIDAARIQAAAQRAADAARGAPVIAPVPPTPPGEPRTLTIRGPNGEQTVIGIPSGALDNTIPPEAVDISIVFFLTIAAIIIGLPLARAFARRMDRRGTSTQIPNEIASQLTHLNQAVDAIALEVERISEGQRFTTRLLSEQKEAARQTLPSGANR